jgi:N-acetylglucosaminyldiphosphoundecaprenol N-acetyl-beta-D-mannosaminyltransferase
MQESSASRITRIFGIPVNGMPRQAILDAIDANIHGERARSYISITSSELLYKSRRSSFLPAYIEGARFSIADGISVSVAAALHGQRIPRFTGPALMEECCRYGVERGWRHFFCGGAEGLADLLSQKLGARFPGLIVAGTYCPPFRALEPHEEEAMIAEINAAKPDILWIGLGVVRQETWIKRYLDRLQVPWLVGVGAAFDFHAGNVQRAPGWMQRGGLEWAHRLYLEPWRYKRTSSAFVFMLEAALEALFGRSPVLGGAEEGDTPPAWRGKRRV